MGKLVLHVYNVHKTKILLREDQNMWNQFQLISTVHDFVLTPFSNTHVLRCSTTTYCTLSVQ